MRTSLTKVNFISEKGEEQKYYSVSAEQSLLKITDNNLSVKFDSKIPENKTTLKRYVKKATSPECRESVVKYPLSTEGDYQCNGR
jgi:DNA-binding transcriptional regulator GbsR (MarR family)